VEAADWIGPRLLPFEDHRVASVLPGGFGAYARVLHPAEERRPSWHGSGWLETSSSGDNGVSGGSRTRLSRDTDAALRDEICLYLTWQLIELVGS
jgi:hypothetical protein